MGRLIRAGAAACALAGGCAGAAGALADQTAGGALQLGPPTVLAARPAGPNTVSDQQGTLSMSGTLTGSGTIDVRAVEHADGTENLTATWTCACTIGGRSATLEARFEGKDADGTFSGSFTISGSGGMHGHGTFTGSDATGAGSYTLGLARGT
jgi:hypothetical protein